MMANKPSAKTSNDDRGQALADDIHERIHELLAEVIEDHDLSGIAAHEQVYWTALGLLDGVICALLAGFAPDSEAQRALQNVLIDVLGEQFLENAKFHLQANGTSEH